MYPYCRVPRHVTCLYVHLIVNCLALCRLALVQADVVVMTQKNNFTVDIFADLPASFGSILPQSGLRGLIVGANPRNACAPIEPPPVLEDYTGRWFVLIRRYDCNFVDKVRYAQLARYDAAIIHNVGSNVVEPMAGDADDIDIPAVFIGQDDGLALLSHYQYNQGYKLLLTDELPFNINSYLLPFAIVVAICFLVMLVFMVVKCIKDRRRMRRYRLPSSSLKNIPTAKFKKGDPYDTCAICLEDYVDGDKLRILPCSHAYHCKCIDPWLTRNRRVCPVCKRRVLVHGEHFSDSESETDETRPLLRPGSYGTQGGTFASNQRLHRQQRRERGRRTSAPAGADVEAGSRLSSASPSPSPSPSLRQAQHRPVLVEEAAVLHSAPTTVEAVVIESLPHNLVLSDIDEVDRSGLAISQSTPESTLQDGTPSFQSIGTISQSMYFTPDKQPDESDTSGSPNNSSGAGSSTVDV